MATKSAAAVRATTRGSAAARPPPPRAATASERRAATGGGDGGSGSLLGVPAVRLVLARLSRSDLEEDKMVDRLERSCRNFDHRRKKQQKGAGVSARKGQESLTVDEYFNVIKLQNGVDIGKDEVKTILSNLPKDKDGRIKVSDFLHKDIHAKDVFQVFDRNKDGYITKGELKLAKKNFAMRDIDEAIKEFDLDGDGKLNKKEFEKSLAKKK